MSDNDEIIMFISRDDHDFVSGDVVKKDHENNNAWRQNDEIVRTPKYYSTVNPRYMNT